MNKIHRIPRDRSTEQPTRPDRCSTRTKQTTLSTILAVVFAACVTSCAADDPLTLNQQATTTTTKAPTTTTSTTSTTTAPPSTTSTTTTTTTTSTVPVTTTRSTTRGDVPTPILEAIQSLWPEDQWNRALRVAFCESSYRLDAANPTSSARGVFQLLAPWRRDPGTGRTVWGWEYTDDGEKLSAAAGLGISEADATSTIANVTVAHEIWSRSGWSPWNASRHCWAGS